jgi:hypothetical protein
MIEGDAGPFQPKKHTPPKQVYWKHETWNINIEPPKPNSLKKQMGHNPPKIKGLYHQRKSIVGPNTLLRGLNKLPWPWTHIVPTYLQNSPKKKKKKKKEVLFEWDMKVDEWHMKTKYPKEEDHWYAPHPKIKPHPKNVWQSLKNPLKYLL